MHSFEVHSNESACREVDILGLKKSIILDLIHLAAWEVLPLFWKHMYYWPTRGNIAVLCKLKKLVDVLTICCAWWFGVEVVEMIQFFKLLYHKNVCHYYFSCLNHSRWIFFGTQNGIVLIFVSDRRDRSCC